MSIKADIERTERKIWARKGSTHDRLVKFLQVVLPVSVGVLAAVLVTTPIFDDADLSFVIDKNDVDIVSNRMRINRAVYRGEDNRGRMFAIGAGSAVQRSASDPVVAIKDISARIALDSGVASILADDARYDMDERTVSVDGPVTLNSPELTLTTRDLDIDLSTRRFASRGPVSGRMDLGTFSANRISGDLDSRVVSLNGNARLRIQQGAL